MHRAHSDQEAVAMVYAAHYEGKDEVTGRMQQLVFDTSHRAATDFKATVRQMTDMNVELNFTGNDDSKTCQSSRKRNINFIENDRPAVYLHQLLWSAEYNKLFLIHI